jgi:1-deoxy-D-xylulose-5-phosphate reductoisomerase
VAILGSTGSIGRQAIDVALENKDRFSISALSTNKNIKLLGEQAALTRPQYIAIADEQAYRSYVEGPGAGCVMDIRTGIDGIVSLCGDQDTDIVLNALVGSVGLMPTIAALKNKKRLCLSNKESLVVGGDLVTRLVEEGNPIIPVDSEHNAIFQCLHGHDKKEIKKIVITASGGPFRRRTKKDLKNVTKQQALSHPRWEMGPKITIDSATLMNKGLEVIEAHYLFGVPYEDIEVVVHPQSTVHSMVEFLDGSIIAHLGPTDMRMPIQFALTYPERIPSMVPGLDMQACEDLTFEPVDTDTFECLAYCYEAGIAGKTYPAVLNAANEEAVAAFLDERIGFLDIPSIIRHVMDAHKPVEVSGVDVLEETQRSARRYAGELISKIRSVRA